jgi:hypothetical protein
LRTGIFWRALMKTEAYIIDPVVVWMFGVTRCCPVPPPMSKVNILSCLPLDKDKITSTVQVNIYLNTCVGHWSHYEYLSPVVHVFPQSMWVGKRKKKEGTVTDFTRQMLTRIKNNTQSPSVEYKS